MKEPALTRELLSEAGKKLGTFNSQSISNTLWCYGLQSLSDGSQEVVNIASSIRTPEGGEEDTPVPTLAKRPLPTGQMVWVGMWPR